MNRHESMTRAWQYYERGRAYNEQLVPNQYTLVNTNIEFFAGNQWLHIPETPAMSRLPKPTFNIIKRVASLFVSSLTSNAATISFEPLSGYGSDTRAAEFATAEVRNLFEKLKMDYCIRRALFDGAQTGDYCAHFYWDAQALPYRGAFGDYRGEICMELVDGINVMFGNPNDCCVERQPYILIVGRDTVGHLRQEAQQHSDDPGAGAEICPDSEWSGQAGQGGQTELPAGGEDDGKALYCYLYTKQNGTVRVTKATRTCVIYEDVDTGLTRYPVAWGNWERQKNQYHGRALVTGIIPNQIFINSMFAMVMRHLQLMGFPKTVYNADLIGRWSNEIGQAIGVRNLQPGQDVRQAAANLQPADMSAQILACIDKAMSYTKDCLGATDAQMGNVRPDNTSALMVLQSSAEVPLENTRAGLYEWLEDIGEILLDMMGTYYGQRPVMRERAFSEPVRDAQTGAPVIDPQTGQMVVNETTRRVAESFDFSVFKNLWLNLRVDVGATTYFSEIAMVQTLDNLRADGTLELIDYLERVPDKLIPRKTELIEKLRQRQGQPAGSTSTGGKSQAGALPAMGGALSDDKTLASLPSSIQARYEALPNVAQRALINQGA